MTTKFKNKNGSLTRYAFSCGYIEQKETDAITLQLYLDGVWHVKAYDYENHSRLFWECFDKLTDARAFFKKQTRALTA